MPERTGIAILTKLKSYRNEVIPRARGNAAKIVNDALAYKEKRIAEAQGDVANFIQILEQYQQGKDVTRIRMYLETMEEILPGIDKYFVDSQDGLIKFLPLQPGQTNQNRPTQQEGELTKWIIIQETLEIKVTMVLIEIMALEFLRRK